MSSTSERHINLFEVACLTDVDASAERKIYQITEEPDPESKNPEANDDAAPLATDKALESAIKTIDNTGRLDDFFDTVRAAASKFERNMRNRASTRQEFVDQMKACIEQEQSSQEEEIQKLIAQFKDENTKLKQIQTKKVESLFS